ncbi:uncharacterized protein LOC144572939 [Carex rostrata]
MHLQQQEKLFQFLMGLNESYATVRSQVLTMDPLPSVNKIYSLALQEEEQRNLCIAATQPLEAVAMATSMKEIEQQVSGRGREGRGRGEKPRCDHCGFIGHVRQNCYKLRGYSNRGGTQEKPMSVANVTTNEAAPNSVVPQLTQGQYQQLMSLLNIGNSQFLANLAGPINEDGDLDG